MAMTRVAASKVMPVRWLSGQCRGVHIGSPAIGARISLVRRDNKRNVESSANENPGTAAGCAHRGGGPLYYESARAEL